VARELRNLGDLSSLSKIGPVGNLGWALKLPNLSSFHLDPCFMNPRCSQYGRMTWSGLWGDLKKVGSFVYHASGAADVVGCATHPTLGGCAMAVATILLTAGTFGEGTVARMAADGLINVGRSMAERAGTAVIKVVASSRLRNGIVAGLSAVHALTPWADLMHADQVQEAFQEARTLQMVGAREKELEALRSQADDPVIRPTPSSLNVGRPGPGTVTIVIRVTRVIGVIWW
jgi:hypothetical protein